MKITLASLLILAAFPAFAGEAPVTFKLDTTAPPKELKEPLHALLAHEAVHLTDARGSAYATLWFRKVIPVRAAPEQVKNGLTYREVPQTTLVGALQLHQPWIDFRNQKIAAGVYTLRMGYQPMDGDHQGVTPHTEFLLLVPAAMDAKPDAMEIKDLIELSANVPGGSHPGVMSLFPNDKPEAEPKMVGKPGNVWVLNCRRPVGVEGTVTTLGFGVVVQGHADRD